MKIIDKKGRHRAKDLNSSIFNEPRKPIDDHPENIFYKEIYKKLCASLLYLPFKVWINFTQKYTNKLAVILSRKKIKYLL